MLRAAVVNRRAVLPKEPQPKHRKSDAIKQMSDRKYRQRGYQDSERRDSDRRDAAPDRRPPPRENLGGPRALKMPGRRTVLRCAGCGTLLAPNIETSGRCPRCGYELHSCKQCVFFDTGKRFECAKPIVARIARKDERNDCTFYEPRLTVERDTSSAAGSVLGANPRPADARAAFENLFKK